MGIFLSPSNFLAISGRTSFYCTSAWATTYSGKPMPVSCGYCSTSERHEIHDYLVERGKVMPHLPHKMYTTRADGQADILPRYRALGPAVVSDRDASDDHGYSPATMMNVADYQRLYGFTPPSAVQVCTCHNHDMLWCDPANFPDNAVFNDVNVTDYDFSAPGYQFGTLWFEFHAFTELTRAGFGSILYPGLKAMSLWNNHITLIEAGTFAKATSLQWFVPAGQFGGTFQSFKPGFVEGVAHLWMCNFNFITMPTDTLNPGWWWSGPNATKGMGQPDLRNIWPDGGPPSRSLRFSPDSCCSHFKKFHSLQILFGSS